MMVALACGFRSVTILVAPKADRETLASQAELTDVLTAGLSAGEDRIVLLDTEDPDAMSEALYSHEPKSLKVDSILPLGRRRDVTRLAARALARGKEIEPVALPDGAPYGAVLLDDEACTLCLSCASLCPSGALSDNPDRPQLRFQEDACLQCGLCVNVCPENAITLQPRLDISKQALSQQVLKEEEPYACIECGKPFGVKSTIERIVAQAGRAAFDVLEFRQYAADPHVRRLSRARSVPRRQRAISHGGSAESAHDRRLSERPEEALIVSAR